MLPVVPGEMSLSLRNFIVFKRSISGSGTGTLSADDIIYFKLMFSMGCFTDAYGEGGVSVVQPPSKVIAYPRYVWLHRRAWLDGSWAGLK